MEPPAASELAPLPAASIWPSGHYRRSPWRGHYPLRRTRGVSAPPSAGIRYPSRYHRRSVSPTHSDERGNQLRSSHQFTAYHSGVVAILDVLVEILVQRAPFSSSKYSGAKELPIMRCFTGIPQNGGSKASTRQTANLRCRGYQNSCQAVLLWSELISLLTDVW